MTKNRKKLILTAITMTMMATLLSACSGESSDAAQPVSTTAQANTEAVETTEVVEEVEVVSTVYGEVKSIGGNMVTLELGELPEEIKAIVEGMGDLNLSEMMGGMAEMGGNRGEMGQGTGDGTGERPSLETDENGETIIPEGAGENGENAGNSQRPSVETDENGDFVMPEGMERPTLETDENGEMVIPEEFEGMLGDMSEEDMENLKEGMAGMMGGMSGTGGMSGLSGLSDIELEMTGENESYLIPTELKVGFSDYTSIEKGQILSLGLDENGEVVTATILTR